MNSQQGEPEIAAKVRWLDSMIETGGRSLSDLRAADRRYDDLEETVFVLADASCERGACFATAVERIERGVTEETARAELSKITRKFAEPYGALVPHHSLDLVLGSAISAEELSLAQTWLLSRPNEHRASDSARMIAITSGMMALTFVTEAVPTLDLTTPAELLEPVPRSPMTLPRIPERVTGDRAPVDARRRYPMWGPLQSYDGDLLSRAEELLVAHARSSNDGPPFAILLAYASSDPGNTIAATWLSHVRGVPRDELRARLRAMDDGSLELLIKPLVFARLLPRAIVPDLLEARGPVMASVIAMWLEKVPSEVTPIVALGHESLLLATEAHRAGT